MRSVTLRRNILCHFSYWEIPVLGWNHKKGKCFFSPNKNGPFSVEARQDAKAKADVWHRSKGWFYKVMPKFCGHGYFTHLSVRIYTVFLPLVLKIRHWTLWLGFKIDGNWAHEDKAMRCLKSTYIALKVGNIAADLSLHKSTDTSIIALMKIEKKKWHLAQIGWYHNLSCQAESM